MRRIAFAFATVAVILVGAFAYATWTTCCTQPAEIAVDEPIVGPVSTGPVPNFSIGAWGLDNSPDPTQFAKVPGDTGPGPVVQHPDFPYTNDSRNASRRMADTSNPILKPETKAKMDLEVARVMKGVMATRAMNEEALTGIAFIPTSRCWLGGVPGTHLYTGDLYFLQKPDMVYIIQQRDSIRRVHMNRPHSDNPGYSWFGESIGHYENGDTLVVDTIGLDDKGPIDRVNTPHSKQLHVIERYQIINNGERMRVVMDIEDPGVFTMPFKAMVEYANSPDAELEEWVCNENSVEYWIPAEELVPVPSATRRDF
jgi:hypothetical protein